MALSSLLSFPIKYYWSLLGITFIIYLFIVFTTFYQVKDSYKSLQIYYSDPPKIGEQDITSAIFILTAAFNPISQYECMSEFYPLFHHYDFITRSMIEVLNSSTSFDIFYTIFFQKNPLKLVLEGIEHARIDIRDTSLDIPLEESRDFCEMIMEWKETNKNMLNLYQDIFNSISNCYSKKYLYFLEILASLVIVKIGFVLGDKYANTNKKKSI